MLPVRPQRYPPVRIWTWHRRGEETLSDPDVRDTWEIPKHLVGAEWNDGMLKVILATVKEELVPVFAHGISLGEPAGPADVNIEEV